MKTLVVRLVLIPAFLSIGFFSAAQVEIKGSGTTGATSTLITKNGNNDTSMIIRDDGRIGIGTTNPTKKLDVNGVINARNGVQYPDGLIQTFAYTGSAPNFANTFFVSVSGGNFPTISAAIAACLTPSATNQYLIEIMPGIYNENIFCQKFVSLRGAGKNASKINGFVIAADSIVIEGLYINGGLQCPGVSPTILHNIITNKLVINGNGIDLTAPGNHGSKRTRLWDARDGG